MRFVTNMAWCFFFLPGKEKQHFIGKVVGFNLCQFLLTENVAGNKNLTNELKSGAQAHWFNGSSRWLSSMRSVLTWVGSVQVCLFVCCWRYCLFIFLKLLRKEHSKQTNPRYFAIIDDFVLYVFKRNSMAAKQSLFYT